MQRVASLVFAVFILAACGGPRTQATPTHVPVPTFTPTPQAAQVAQATSAPFVQPTPATSVDLCETVTPGKIDNIVQGLTVTGGGTLDAVTARAVRSSDYEQVYFIAAEIDGNGMEGTGQIGIWASNSLEPAQGLIFAIDGLATEFSDWGDGATTDAQMTISSAGARDAKECVRAQQP